MPEKTKKEAAVECYETGEGYGAKGDADGAIKWWKKTIELDPKHFLAWYNLGNVYFWGKQDVEQSFEYWEKALELKPDTTVVHQLISAIKKNNIPTKIQKK